MPNPINVPITPPRVAFLDPRTGNVSREWYMFFYSLFQSQGGSNVSLDDLQKGPPPVTIDEVGRTHTRIAELELTPSQPQLGTMAPMNKEFMDYIGWNQNAGVAVQPGQIAWNSGDGTLDIGMGYDGVVLQTGLESLYRIRASATITNGQLIQFDGAVGASGVIKGKPSTTGLTEGLYIMGVATMDIANNGFGYVTNFGLVRGINTTGASVGETWADGDILYYNPSYVGGMTNARPVSPAEVVVVAAVVNAGPGGSGSLFVRPSFYPKLTELSDVYARTPNNGDVIVWNASNARWQNVSPGTTTAPVTYTANFSVADTDVWIINNKSGSSCTATLPTASSYTGRTLHFQNYQAQTLVSASSNVVPLAGGAATTAILAAVAGETCTLVSNGTNWVMTQYTPNNVLLLE